MPFIASKSLAPVIPNDLTPEQSVRLWIDVMDSCEQFLLAGLRCEVGPDGDLRAAYQEWYAGWQVEHDRMWKGMAERMAHCKAGSGDGR